MSLPAPPHSQTGGPQDADQSLEDRYGTGRQGRLDKRFAWGAAGVLVAAGVGFLLFSGWHQQSNLEVQDIGYSEPNEYSLDVKFNVSAPPDTPVACAVEALNTSKATVGWKVVEIPPTDDRDHTITTNVVITNPATAATARECWVVE